MAITGGLKRTEGNKAGESGWSRSVKRSRVGLETEWRTGLYVQFMDFEKDFDSVHRESLWNIMRSYAIRHKTVRVIPGLQCL